ncbi:hypothetical protein PBY51_016011 [Eleginops maclovinus]|uniref:RIMS-binding protein 1/2/3 Fn3 domain-containing protein n=1 Tax=Eleginops maclovinus TaxID=56733 RepID=A0AAN7XJX3_ELEMC|nr:hypothetical protein PBY51_016011 [Eleginops maclovinus]
MTVSAATGMTKISAVRITAGTVTHWEEQERLPPMRGEGEGEEEGKEERRRQWQSSVGNESKGENKIQGGPVKDATQTPNEARLQGFVLSLQEDLRVLLEREEDGMSERRRLMEQLQEAQENSHFLGCKLEDMKAEVQQLKLSESSLMEEAGELKEKNHRLKQSITDAAKHTATCPSPGTNTVSHTATGEVHLTSDEGTGQPYSSVVPPVHPLVAAESLQDNTEDRSSSAKSENSSKTLKNNSSPQTLSLTKEKLDENKRETWCSKGILNLEVSPSEESDALMEAYRSLGLGDDLKALQAQRDRLEVALEHTQEQLRMMAQENTQLKLQLKKDSVKQEADAQQGSSNEEVSTLPTSDRGEDDLVLALNQENRALAERIQELLAHIELREEEMKRERTHLREHISKLEADRVRLKQESQEQECLITELTKKTEDDLNSIMELQQRLVESEQRTEESQISIKLQSEFTAATAGSLQQKDLEECVDSFVENMLKGDEPQCVSSEQAEDLTSVTAASSLHDNHDHLLSSLHVSALIDKVSQLTKTVQRLKTEGEELSGNLNTLREQQREVSLSIQTQTEVKQQLTRTVWGLKEEKDGICKSVAGLKQERDQLTRTVCGLKDEREQLIKSMSGLKEEKDSLSGLEIEKEKLLESLSCGKEERDQIMQSLQSLQTERNQLSQTVLYLKVERDELTDALKCLKKQKDEERSSSTSQEEREGLIKLASTLREDKERIEHSISCLKQEEEQIKLLIQGLREETNSLKAALPSQTQTEGKNQKQYLLTTNSSAVKTTETAAETGERCQTQDYGGNTEQEQSDLRREIEALGAELKTYHEELDQSRVDAKRLQRELCQSESRRKEAERKAADKVVGMTAVANQMEETRKETESLTTQVKQLQSKLSSLLRERTEALSLKTQIEERHNILTAQLRAKTVALEELNSEYIALKRGQGSKEDLSTALYDELLKKRSHTDLEIAPLRAKLSCLVVKCQERNGLLIQMMKDMSRRGCADSTLTLQVEHLLSDAALLDYTAAFTPGSNVKTRDYSAGERVSLSRRLSSPEKIINLHEQLQRTLMSSFKDPEGRGRGHQPRKCLSFSASADLRPVALTKKQSLSLNEQDTNSLPVTAAAVSQAKHTPALMSTNKSNTLFNAVTSRSAHVTFSPNLFTYHHFKAETSKTTTCAISSCPLDTVAVCKAKPISSIGTNVTTSTKKITAVLDESDAKQTAPTPFTLKTCTIDSDVLICSETSPKTTASDTTAQRGPTALEDNHFNTPCETDGAPPAYHGPLFAAPCTPPAHCSPERSKTARKSTAALQKIKTARSNPEAPAEVRSVAVIRTVGQSSLLIGWERPPLDELGCSNGTFVYGYRVFLDGDFHKSVMSSACTKCILENVNLSVPVNISVQTLGSNALTSDFVHTMYSESVRTDSLQT